MKFFHDRLLLALLASLLVTVNAYGQRTATKGANYVLPAETAIDAYVRKPDASYRWKVVGNRTVDGVQNVVIDMVSQTWLSAEEVDRPEWQHWLVCAVPAQIRSETGFLMIGGGSNRSKQPPEGADRRIMSIAQATGSVVAELRMVPNQPLVFHNDGKRRSEDDLIGYTWDQYLETGNPTWLARNPMVKSAVRAMDTITAMMASETGGRRTVDKFVVAGGSKRGWTTWLTGAIDPRVVGIVPIVIDVLNADESMRHHFAAYGYWAPAVGDYVRHRIMERISHPRLREAYALVDPYYYRHRLTMPKLILNAAGDQFFLPDSSRFYWDDLQGPKYLRYVPNGDHGLDDTDALETITAFYGLLLSGRKPPTFDWTQEQDGSFRVSVQEKPQQVRLWHATNPDTRDFRIETLGAKYVSETVEATDEGVYVANVPKPDQGWTAYFVELTYDVGMPVPLKLTTNVRVVPDILPYADKPLDEPGTVTVVGRAASDVTAFQATEAIKALVQSGQFKAENLQTETDGSTCFINWRPGENGRQSVGAVAKFLEQQGCEVLRFQLESGANITR